MKSVALFRKASILVIGCGRASMRTRPSRSVLNGQRIIIELGGGLGVRDIVRLVRQIGRFLDYLDQLDAK